ncbi:MAG: hypothetical protein VB124_03575 [Burkholderia sp.]
MTRFTPNPCLEKPEPPQIVSAPTSKTRSSSTPRQNFIMPDQ